MSDGRAKYHPCMTPTGRQPGERGLGGWERFAGIVLLVAGVLNIVNGFTALEHSGYYVHDIVYSNLTFWGWAFLVWGALQVLAGWLVLARNDSGRPIGVFLAGLAAVLWFFLLFAAPFEALIGVLVNVLVIYGLTVKAEGEAYL